MKQGYVYILTNRHNTVLYTGVTSDLKKRVWEHKQHLVEGFTKRYNVEKLVYYEAIDDIAIAIAREKQIKAEIASPQTARLAMTDAATGRDAIGGPGQRWI